MQVKFFVLFTVLFSCSSPGVKEYKYPESNPNSELFETVADDQYGNLLRASITTSSLQFDCIERSDQPYFWCGIDGEFVKVKGELPKKLETIFHVQIPKWGVRNVRKIINKIKMRSRILTVIIHRNPNIDEKNSAFESQLFLFHDNSSCVAFLNSENHCPASSKIENIYIR